MGMNGGQPVTQEEKLIDIISNYDSTVCSAKEFAEYLIDNGVVVLPCKVGDTVWSIHNDAVVKTECYSVVAETEDDHFAFILTCTLKSTFDPRVSYFVKKFFGKTVFLTREEAEAALKGAVNRLLI